MSNPDSADTTSTGWPRSRSMPVGLVGLNRFVNRVNRWRKGIHAKQYPRVKLHLVLGGLMQATIGWFILGLQPVDDAPRTAGRP